MTIARMNGFSPWVTVLLFYATRECPDPMELSKTGLMPVAVTKNHITVILL